MAGEKPDMSTPADATHGGAGSRSAASAGGDQPRAEQRSGRATNRPTPRLFAKFPISPANLVLVGLFVVAALCLYFLSLRNGPRMASAEEQAMDARVEAALTQMSSPASAQGAESETTGVLDTFFYEAKQRQVPIARIPGNAFIYTCPSPTNYLPSADGQRADPQETQQEDQAALDAIQSAKQLKLQSVLTGAQGATAMISGNLVRKGEVISGWTVKAIRPREVLLTWKDQEYLLQMQ